MFRYSKYSLNKCINNTYADVYSVKVIYNNITDHYHVWLDMIAYEIILIPTEKGVSVLHYPELVRWYSPKTC